MLITLQWQCNKNQSKPKLREDAEHDVSTRLTIAKKMICESETHKVFLTSFLSVKSM